MKSLMVVGTTSHAGKSLLTAAICRILARRGLKVAPFKGQNMALNAYVTKGGGEIGYAQALQAWAAGVSPQVAMNPILLKPQGDMTSQVILRGHAVGVTSAEHYYEDYFEIGWQAIAESLEKLGQQFDWVVCEGAGSPAEINLKHRDLTNMRVARHLNAATLLVVDIDRGGAFAHVVGTLELLDPEERALIRGVVINKFRGRRELLDSGIEWLEQRTGIPVLGVIPWVNELFPAEDSLDLLERRGRKSTAELTVAVLRFPRIANFTDFDPLEAEPSVRVRYVDLDADLGQPDVVVLPGSKTTIADLIALQRSGMHKQLKTYHAAGGQIFGICGGFQMLGDRLTDPEGFEGPEGRYDGLGFLPTRTVFTGSKVVRQRQCQSRWPDAGLPVSGYEIHQGNTQIHDGQAERVTHLFDDPQLGILGRDGQVGGTYLHGLFESGAWRRSWLNRLRRARGLNALPTALGDYREQREDLLNRLTDVVDEYLNLEPLLVAAQSSRRIA